MQSFFIVFGQVLSLFIMIGVGFAMYKVKFINDTGAAQMTDLLLYAVTPCIVINAFNRKFDPNTASAIGVFAVTGLLVMLLGIIVATLVFRGKDKNSRAVQRFSLVFSNCGFMGIPLAQAICGQDGVLYSSIFMAIFNLYQWTYGVTVMSGQKLSIKKAILNPCVLGLAVGIPIFLLSLQIPSPVQSAISMLADLNSPLAMVIIGTHLAKTDIIGTFKDARCYVMALLRLIALPALTMVVVLSIPWLDQNQILTLAVQCGAPVAASCALFATKYECDSQLASRMVALSTIFSMITLPVLISVVQNFM